MSGLRIMNVIGCRPNMVKIAPLISEMNRHPEIEPLLVHTGQHYDEAMSGVFFRDLEIPQPDFCLNVGSASNTRQLALVIQRMEEVLRDANPDLVLVVGDVNSTLAATLVAATLGYPVAHVEAGLRSFDRHMQEEINRVTTDAIADLLFATEMSAVDNLVREGHPSEQIFFVGNVMIDTLRQNADKISQSAIHEHLGLTPNNYALVTLHRSSNVDDPGCLEAITKALQTVQQHVRLVFPIHPRTAQRLDSFGCWQQLASLPNVQMIEPLGYIAFMRLLRDSMFVLTDSGGLQEESTALGIPCLTLRENTERPVTVTEGTNQLVGMDTANIIAKSLEILDGGIRRGKLPENWDGQASRRIVSVLLERSDELKARYGAVRERARCLDSLTRV